MTRPHRRYLPCGYPAETGELGQYALLAHSEFGGPLRRMGQMTETQKFVPTTDIGRRKLLPNAAPSGNVICINNVMQVVIDKGTRPIPEHSD